MEDTDLHNEIEKRVSELPELARNAIFASDLGTRIRTIGATHHLHIDQMDKLEDEVMLVMLGFTTADEFESHLTSQLNTNPEDARVLAAEIGEKIFLPIRQLMQAATPAPHAPAVAPSSVTKTEIHPADLMLSQKTVTTAPVPPPPPPLVVPKIVGPTTSVATPPAIPATVPKPDPAAPQPYKADPYREPLQ